MSNLSTRLREIQERCDAATPGPWRVSKSEDIMADDASGGFIIASGLSWQPEHDFIAHAREDVPFLLAEIDRLRAIEQRLKVFADAGGLDALDAIYILEGEHGSL
jgi:hypothetical protein